MKVDVHLDFSRKIDACSTVNSGGQEDELKADRELGHVLIQDTVSFFACFKISFPSRCWFSFKMFDPFRAWPCLKNR